jgi:hypothetical protein
VKDGVHKNGPSPLFGELFARGPIEIVVTGMGASKSNSASPPTVLSHSATAPCVALDRPSRRALPPPSLETYLPTSLLVACAKNSAPRPRRPPPPPHRHPLADAPMTPDHPSRRLRHSPRTKLVPRNPCCPCGPSSDLSG